MVAGDEVEAAGDEEAIGKHDNRRAWVAAREEYHAEHWLAFESAFCAMYKRMALADKNTPQYADDGGGGQDDVFSGVSASPFMQMECTFRFKKCQMSCLFCS